MHHQRRRVVVGDHHLDVVDHHLVLQLLVYLIYMEKMMEPNFLDEVQNLNHPMQDVVHLDVQQNLDAQNLDVIPPFLVAAHRFLANQLVVVVDVELRHQLKMDCYLDVVGVELRHLLKMDCFLDEVLAQMALQMKWVQQVVLHRFQLRVRQLHAWPLLPYLQSPWLAQV
jgi:hypothetical protein